MKVFDATAGASGKDGAAIVAPEQSTPSATPDASGGTSPESGVGTHTESPSRSPEVANHQQRRPNWTTVMAALSQRTRLESRRALGRRKWHPDSRTYGCRFAVVPAPRHSHCGCCVNR